MEVGLSIRLPPNNTYESPTSPKRCTRKTVRPWAAEKSRSKEMMRSLVAFRAVPNGGVRLLTVHVVPPPTSVCNWASMLRRTRRRCRSCSCSFEEEELGRLHTVGEAEAAIVGVHPVKVANIENSCRVSRKNCPSAHWIDSAPN